MIGTRIGHYHIEAELGRGGMGVVYRAHDERLDRNVAIKLLHGEILSQAERRARILAEARAAAALNHPGITTIYEVAEEGENVFVVMELVSGQLLRAVIGQGPMEPRRLARLGALVAEALDAAHAQKVVHGDIKPENIVALPDGRVKLLDFGIARQMAEETATLTRASVADSALSEGAITGTLAYMAPEVLRGEAPDGRADLYSLGVVLFELATGSRPFRATTPVALAAQILHEPLPERPQATEGLPAELARIVNKLLAKDRAMRYQSAHDLQVDLTNLTRLLEIGSVLPPAVRGKKALAVLPFKLLTPNPEDGYLSVALADAVTNGLTAGGDFLLRPTSTVLRYARQLVDPLLVARELNVQLIVEGSIQKIGNRLRIHVQAWEAGDGTALCSAKHDADMADLFALQDKITERLARALGSKPAEKAPLPRPTRDSTAYELYLRAAERLSRVTRWDTRMSIDMLENAVQRDTKFADAWARLALTCLQMGRHFEPGPKWYQRAEKAARRALALDPHHPEARSVRGQLLWTPAKNFQNRAALRALSEAMRSSPGSVDPLRFRAVIYFHVGLHAEAREGLAEALAADPDDAWTLATTGHLSLHEGKFEEAQDFYARSLKVDPDSLFANLFLPYSFLYSENFERAEEKLRAGSRVAPGDPMVLSGEALLWAKRGEPRKSQQLIRAALRGKSLLHSHHAVHYAAAASAVLGKADTAVSLLRTAAKTGLPNYLLFRDDPHFRRLHSHAPFQRLLAGLKREWEKYRREFGNG